MSTTSTTATATTTSSRASASLSPTTAPLSISPTIFPTASSSNGGGLDSSSALSGQLPLQTVFYFIAFVGLMIAIFYTIYLARRDRRRRRAARANRDDPEM
ncbi:hypothetical protein BGX28_005252, partial [Mortierella sp. GBA30]